MNTMEDLRAEALALATRMCDLTAILASPGFRGAVDMEEVHALTEQLHALATAHFYVLRRIALAERE
jgi:hypothetical protein